MELIKDVRHFYLFVYLVLRVGLKLNPEKGSKITVVG